MEHGKASIKAIPSWLAVVSSRIHGSRQSDFATLDPHEALRRKVAQARVVFDQTSHHALPTFAEAVVKDLYETLGVGRSASSDAIQKAYRRLAKKLHPDLNPGNKDSEERFKEISVAYGLLSDADKRARYDRGEIDATGAENVGSIKVRRWRW